MIHQTSGYGVAEAPGTAFDYNDWQMALLADTLFLEVYGTTWPAVDAESLLPRLTDPLGCQDDPTLLAFGAGDRPGRLAISVRDFARFGLLYLRRGRWGEQSSHRRAARAPGGDQPPVQRHPAHGRPGRRR